MSNFTTAFEIEEFANRVASINEQDKRIHDPKPLKSEILDNSFNKIFKQDGQTVRHVIAKGLFTNNAKAADDMLAKQVRLMQDKVATAGRNDSLIKVIKAFEDSQQCKLSPASLELILNAGAKAIYEGNGIRYGLGSDWGWD